jgi:Fe-S-cluster containining protein
MFNCNQCGECCKNLDKSELYRKLDRGDGTCVYLTNNLCSIYDERPLLCRINDCYEKYFKSQYSLEEYYELNYQICKKLQEK